MSDSTSGKGNDSNTYDFAWHVHDTLVSWTGQVDTKASIALAIEVSLIGFVSAQSVKGGPLSGLHSYRFYLDRSGVILLATSIVLSLWVIKPRLAYRKIKRNSISGMIYFGHLKNWDPDKLTVALSTNIEATTQLARQLVEMSKIAWRKHVLLQWSLIFLLIGSIFVGLAGQ